MGHNFSTTIELLGLFLGQAETQHFMETCVVLFLLKASGCLAPSVSLLSRATHPSLFSCNTAGLAGELWCSPVARPMCDGSLAMGSFVLMRLQCGYQAGRTNFATDEGSCMNMGHGVQVGL